MTGILDNQQIELTCPKCSRKFKERIGRLKNSPLIRCIGCGADIQINAGGKGGLAQGVKSLDKSVADLKSAFKKFGK